MKNQMMKYMIALVILGLLIGCGKRRNPVGPRESYEDNINNGWNAFSVGNYPVAVQEFSKAKQKNTEKAEAYTGLGWSLMKSDSLTQAAEEYSAGAVKTDATADLFAGWAFLLNVQKDFPNSNLQIGLALSIDPNWVFTHWSVLNRNDLLVMKAENLYLLGDYAQSLAYLRLVNPDFNTDITTVNGQAALAREIERLKVVA